MAASALLSVLLITTCTFVSIASTANFDGTDNLGNRLNQENDIFRSLADESVDEFSMSLPIVTITEDEERYGQGRGEILNGVNSPTYDTTMPMLMPKSGKTGKTKETKAPTVMPSSIPAITPQPTHSPTICSKRAQIAFDNIEKLNEESSFDNFPNVTSPEHVKTLCEFAPTASSNFGCSFLFIPQFGFINDYNIIFEPTAATTFYSIVKYCECYLGYQKQCARDIPHGPPPTAISYEITGEFPVPSYSEYIPASNPGARADYCVFASIWNGDVNYDDVILPALVEECGCFWVSEVKDMVSECPGLGLGDFFDYGDPSFEEIARLSTFSFDRSA